MFNNIALDVVIGLIFVFLLYSLFATILQEMLAQFLDLRAKMLVKTVRVLLDDRQNINGNFLSRWGWHAGNNIYHFFCPLPNNTLSKAFYSHPSIKYLAQSSWKSKPSYINASTFANTMMQVLRGQGFDGTEPQMNAIYRTLFEQRRVVIGEGANQVAAAIEPETLANLKQLYQDAQKDADRFRQLLENWYNDTMERTTGWYKKQTQTFLFFIGLITAITFNADTIAIANILAKDKTARENMVQLAANANPQYEPLVKSATRHSNPVTRTETVKRVEGKDTIMTFTSDTAFVPMTSEELNAAYSLLKNDIDKAGNILGLGRRVEDSCKICDTLNKRYEQLVASAPQDSAAIATIKDSIQYYNRNFYCNGNPYQRGGLVTFLGWVIMALAISLGAPFWFDLLNKVIKLRAAGNKPPDTPSAAAAGSNAPGSSPIQRVG